MGYPLGPPYLKNYSIWYLGGFFLASEANSVCCEARPMYHTFGDCKLDALAPLIADPSP